jgi:hypothetical protein
MILAKGRSKVHRRTVKWEDLTRLGIFRVSVGQPDHSVWAVALEFVDFEESEAAYKRMLEEN